MHTHMVGFFSFKDRGATWRTEGFGPSFSGPFSPAEAPFFCSWQMMLVT